MADFGVGLRGLFDERDVGREEVEGGRGKGAGGGVYVLCGGCAILGRDGRVSGVRLGCGLLPSS